MVHRAQMTLLVLILAADIFLLWKYALAGVAAGSSILVIPTIVVTVFIVSVVGFCLLSR